MVSTVQDLMRRDFIQIGLDEDLGSVARLMGMARVRALPVVAEGRLAGMVSHGVLARAAFSFAQRGRRVEAPITDYLDPVEPIRPDATLREAAERMIENRLPCLPVAAGGGAGHPLLGLLTESDLLRAAYP